MKVNFTKHFMSSDCEDFLKQSSKGAELDK